MNIGRGFILSWFLAGTVAGADSDVRVEFPLESEGDIDFFVDTSSYRGTAEMSDQEVYVAVTNDQLVFEEEGAVLSGSVKLEIVVRTADGEEVFSRESKLEPQAASELDAEDRGILQIIREQVLLPPGRHHLQVRLLDERSQRAGLLNRIRKKKKVGFAQGWVDVRSFHDEEIELSDLTLVRSAKAADGGSVFGRNGVDFDPNPSRLFGLAVPYVRSYLEVYTAASTAEERSFLVRTKILDRTGSPVVAKTTRARPQGASFVVTDALALAPRDVPAGSYFLQVEVEDEGTHAIRSIQRDFEVIWSVLSWGQEPEEVLQEMRLIMTDSEYDTLERLSAGAREIYLAEYWHSLDPFPETSENEALQTFNRRIRYADREYVSTLQRGILTDRGRVFVRFGPPDDIMTEYSSSGFGSEGGDERVADPGERVRLGNRPATSFLDPDEFREGDVSGLAEQRGGANIKAKELEIWVYDGHGAALTKHQDLDENSHRGLKFIFADEMGNGNFDLIGSRGTTLY